jgi:hypothetical protein
VISAEKTECSGHPSTRKTKENVDQVKEIVHENKRITIHEVANMLGISSFGSVQSILKEHLNMHQIATKFVPHQLRGSTRRIMSTCARTFKGDLKETQNSFEDNHR